MLNQKVKILIVEDDPDMAELICDLVEAEGWIPITAPSAEIAQERLQHETVQLVLVDHNLPGLSGSATDRVLGLETAADDYVVKPFEPNELTARIKAVLRRTHPQLRHDRESEREQPSTALRLGEWAVDLAQRRAVCLTDPTKTLTAAEFALLEILAETPNSPVSRAQILDRMGADSDRFVDRNVDVLVLRLRRKIERNPDLPSHIQTRRGKGYVLHTHDAGSLP